MNLYRKLGKLGRESSEELQEMARKRNILTNKDVQSIQQGWEGKQKGLLQVLWERWWIDESKLDEYKLIKRDDKGIVVDESLEVMLASCLDFADEITELQAKGEEMVLRVIPSTKFHAETAGEGIEYLWGVGKGWYSLKPLELKRKKASFVLQLVHNVLDPELAMTKKRVWSFSKRARAYICAY
jgi:hypothetical protein